MTQQTADMCMDLYESLLDSGYDRERAVVRVALSSGFSADEVEEALGLDIEE